MDAQCSVEEICSTRFCCGESESLRSVTFPRTASRCCPGSVDPLRSYRVNVKASRSRAAAGSTKPHRTERTERNLIKAPAAFVAQPRTAQLPQQRKHLARGLCRAS